MATRYQHTTVPIKIPRRQSAYDIRIGSGSLGDSGKWAASILTPRTGCRVLLVSNRRVFDLYGGPVLESLRKSGFEVHTHLIGDGERFKNLRILEGVLRVLSERGFTRTDAIVALGGGVVGDLASFAASIHLRGIHLLQIPTTLLAMIDSSVGGKTAVNTPFGKNLIGTFYQPDGVMIDVQTLRTLPRREVTAGLCEVVKQSAIASKALFAETREFLEQYGGRDFEQALDESDRLVGLITGQVKFKAKIVQNDETEAPENRSSTSRKILNFGHTLGHALEKATNFSYLRHGEAVGHGVLFAAELSKRLELISQDEVNSLNDVVHRAGDLPAISHIATSEILESLKSDKKHIGNSLQWVLLRGIGKPVIVPDTEIARSAITSTLSTIFRK